MSNNGKIAAAVMVTVASSKQPGRHIIGLSPSLGITATANANDQVIIEGSNESLIYLAEIILERCK